MTDTAELIARLGAYRRGGGRWRDDDAAVIKDVIAALAAQAQEIEQLQSLAANAALNGCETTIDAANEAHAQRKRAEAAEARVAQLDKDWRSISDELCAAEARCNVAEDRVRELEGQNEWLRDDKGCALLDMKRERDAIEAKTIERAVEAVRNSYGDGTSAVEAIRALRHGHVGREG